MVHRNVGVFEQGRGISAVVGEEAAADGWRDDQFVVFDGHRRGDRLRDLGQDRGQFIAALHVIEDDDKFIAAKARH